MKKMKKLKDTKFWKKLRQSEFLKKLWNTRVMRIVAKTKLYLFLRYRVVPHLYSFWIPWTLLLLILGVAIIDIPGKLWCMSLFMLLFVAALVFASMNVIHGLIGTRGNIRMFFFMFLIINFLFASVYYRAFFKDAGITYDVNQPHVEFNIFEKCDEKVDCMIVESNGKETVMVKGESRQLKRNGWYLITPEQREKVGLQKGKKEHVPDNDTKLSRYYHRIRYDWVLQNTLLTSLMQEPTNFYSVTSTYNGNYEETDRNVKMSRNFHWFLVFHILISWIFLGVFISLIYQKFRNN